MFEQKTKGKIFEPNTEKQPESTSSSMMEALTKIQDEGTRRAETMKRLRAYLNELPSSAALVRAVVAFPGLDAENGRAAITAMQTLVQSRDKAVESFVNQAQKKAKEFDFVLDLELPGAKELITRSITEEMTSVWIESRGKEIYTPRMAMYLEYAVRVLSEQHPNESAGARIESISIDAVMALNKATQLIEQALNEFIKRSNLPSNGLALLMGNDNMGDTFAAAQTVMDAVIRPLTQIGCECVAKYVVRDQISARDRQIVYRSALNQLTQDSVMALRYQSSAMLNRVIAMPKGDRAKMRKQDGALIVWLRAELERRMPALFMVPEGYFENTSVSINQAGPADQEEI